ncbi:MAG: hypothetical protein KatS3mg026_0922 [Bacteroidia bacterium]|nr:MAG: hypothetical protein KatS3mg026_0922 [Bacteroidia bacterium]
MGVSFFRDPNTGTLVRSDSQVFRFSVAGSGVKVEVSHYAWDQGAWQITEKDSAWVRLVGSLSLIDSLKIFYYDPNTQSWTSYERIDWTYDSQNRQTKMHYRSDENPDTSFHQVMRSFYEPTAPGRKIRDSLELYQVDEIGPGAPNKIPGLRAELLYRYDGSTSKVVADSGRFEGYISGMWVFILASKNTYTYDPSSDSLSVHIVSGCVSPFTPCTPTPSERYRYVWKQVAVAFLAEGGVGSLRLPNPLHAGQQVTLPLPAGQTWRLLNLQGQELARGQTGQHGTTLQLPAQSGIYLLQVGAATARLLLLP